MRFLLAVFDTRSESATTEEMARIGELNDRLRNDNHLIMAVGLADPTTAVDFDGRNESAVGGSSKDAETQRTDFMSGFWILEAPSPDVAQGLAHEAAQACRRRVQLRKILG